MTIFALNSIVTANKKLTLDSFKIISNDKRMVALKNENRPLTMHHVFAHKNIN